jgi:23S rRNA (guanosine2251-2'-O)-methyltransferase
VNIIRELKENGFWIVGLDMTGDRLYTEVDCSGPIAIVVGGEAKGIRRLVKEHCDFVVRIPILGKISSLNASVAGALMMYEVRRQRTANQG